MIDMKTLLSIVIMIILIGLIDIQSVIADENPVSIWEKTFVKGTGYDAIQSDDGGYVITGVTYSHTPGGQLLLIKTDKDGVEQWNRTIGEERVIGCSIQQTSDGGYILLGLNIFTMMSELLLVKTNFNGIIQWNKSFINKEYCDGKTVHQTSDGGYVLLGHKKINNVTYGWLIKTDTDGVEQWNKTYGSAKYLQIFTSLQITSDRGFIIGGQTTYNTGNGTGWKGWLIKTDSKGVEQWNRTYGGKIMTGFESLANTNDGGYIITGYTFSFNKNGSVWLLKTDVKGVEQWNRTFGEEDHFDTGSSVQQTTDNGYIITGRINIDPHEDVYQGFVIKTNSTGGEEWYKKFETQTLGYSIIESLNGGFVVTGYKKIEENTRSVVWLSKINLPGDSSNNSTHRTTPGFELLISFLAIVLILSWKRKKSRK
jgi:hypothetical protein